ncbi:hypothetical protein EGR_01907 [Echinococcus granulosus]|uniref:Uncharacterized protein n=1 Tax=Echinococcus granulosus TaxID=6210 RepID=W6URU7_ECHGR|nr:hypothetical protein EGR_01907 [Echinococcus granulosus]EUB63416.1 hypothetical protein EGR_01907 [Echinococcus granulosus]
MCCRACCYRGPPRITPKHIAPDHITWYRVVPNLQELGGLNNTATGPRLLSSLQSVSNSATQAAEFGLRLHLDLHLQLRAHTDIQPKQNRSVDASPCGVKDCYIDWELSAQQHVLLMRWNSIGPLTDGRRLENATSHPDALPNIFQFNRIRQRTLLGLSLNSQNKRPVRLLRRCCGNNTDIPDSMSHQRLYQMPAKQGPSTTGKGMPTANA